MFNETSLHLWIFFFISTILFFFAIYANHICCRLSYLLILCVVLFLVLIHIHLLPPLIICLPSTFNYLDCQTLIPLPSPLSFTWCLPQQLISTPEPHTFPPPLIYPPSVYFTKSLKFMLPLYLFSKITSSPSPPSPPPQ